MAPTQLYTIPIASRPQKTWFQLIHGIVCLTVYLTGCVMVNATQLVFVLPLLLIPGKRARALHEEGVRYTKGAFGKLITLVCQLFAPTTIRITFETDGIGKFKPEEIEQIVIRDSSGRVVELRLPSKLVIIGNHQVYADWWYLWCLTYFMNMHRDVLIVLKRSLKWIPVLGWGMQFFRFIFLDRSWASDKHHLVSRLAQLGRKAQLEDTPLALFIYPEGTLVSVDTRPVSKKFADKMGIADMTHMLLPRSTGLHYSLRALAPRIPNLKLLDITMAYPGIPPMGYGQSYYTLRSIFLDRVPPPTVHMHLRLLDVASSVPIGDLSGTNAAATPPVAASAQQPSYPSPAPSHANEKTAIEADVSEAERVVFDDWVRALWRLKDEKLEAYYQSGSKRGDADGVRDDKVFDSGLPAVEIPLELRNPLEALDAFCFFGPAVVGWAWKKVLG